MKATVLSLSLIALLASVVNAQTRLPLDDTGISDWRFLNPVRPHELTDSGDLEIVNTTGNRTFVVTIPFVYQGTEFKTAYTVDALRRASAAQSLDTVVCEALFADPGLCTAAIRRTLREVEVLKQFQEVLERQPVPKTLDETCASTETMSGGCSQEARFAAHAEWAKMLNQPGGCPKPVDVGCLAETVFWTAACDVGVAEVTRFALGDQIPAALRPDPPTGDSTIVIEARTALERLFCNVETSTPACTEGCAYGQRRDVLKAIDEATSETGRSPLPSSTSISSFLKTESPKNARERFREARFNAAKLALMAATRRKIENGFKDLTPVMAAFENQRLVLERQIESQEGDVDAIARCQLRELQSAARLLVSYGVEAVIPFQLSTLDLASSCLRVPPASADKKAAAYIETVERGQAEQRRDLAEAADAEISVIDCSSEAGDKVTCTATATLGPNQRALFTRSVLQHHPEPRLRIAVAYFDDTEPPPNATAYVLRDRDPQRKLAKPKGQYLFGFGADAGSAYDLPAGFQGHARRVFGAGSLSFQYTGPVDVSATLRFKRGDFGGPTAASEAQKISSTSEVSATQYQTRIYNEQGWIVQYGRLLFAQPSAGIALSEEGEGLRVSWRGYSGAYVVRRESDALNRRPDAANDDNDVLLLQVVNPGFRISTLRNFVGSLAFGEEKNDTAVTIIENGANVVVVPVPYRYATLGFDSRFGFRRTILGVAAYHSRRDIRPSEKLVTRGDRLDSKGDGEGTVVLSTLSWNKTAQRKLTDPPSKTKAAYGLTLFVGAGSGDDSNTTTRNEGYLGENAGYANDVIFLNQISKDPKYEKMIGRGLANKYYIGLQYTDARYSILNLLTSVFGGEADVQSKATVFSAHFYRFNRDVQASKNAGWETDVEFKLEAPKNVRWSVKGAFYRPSSAVKSLDVSPRLGRNPWSVAGTVSVTLDGR